MTVAEMRSEALARAAGGSAVRNYAAIYAGFMDKGIPEAEIKPRENVFTFHAWRALNRHVRKGEHGVRVTTWIPVRAVAAPESSAEPTGEAPAVPTRARIGKRPKTAVVFPVSQTEPD